MTGVLVLVATPIGNLGDLAPRAAEELSRADRIACEDTRRTGRLLDLAGLDHGPMTVLNEHTEREATETILAELAAGRRVAVASDAGMPAISDPGAFLVRSAADAGFEIVAVPGASAVVTAVALSGLDSSRFVFEGFLPRKGRERAARLAEAAAERRTMVFYEAPHRLVRTLDDLVEAAGPDRPVAICRELTKMHEQVWRGRLSDAVAAVGTPRGEFVIVLGGAAPPDEPSDDDIRHVLAEARRDGASTRDAVAEVVAELGVAKRRVYDLALER